MKKLFSRAKKFERFSDQKLCALDFTVKQPSNVEENYFLAIIVRGYYFPRIILR